MADGRKGSDSLADFSRQPQIETFETAGVAVLEQSHEPAGAAAVRAAEERERPGIIVIDGFKPCQEPAALAAPQEAEGFQNSGSAQAAAR